MMHVMRKYNKKIMAIIGVFLMIAFIIPSVAKRGGPGSVRLDATIAGKAVTNAEYVRALNDWRVLTAREMQIVQPVGRRPDGQYQYAAFSLMELSLANRLSGAFGASALQIARQAVHRLDDVTFMLLLKEAQAMKVRVSEDEVKSALEQFKDQPTEDPQGRVQAVTDWLTILTAFDQMADAVKITPAMATAAIAQSEEQVAVKLVEFKAQDFVLQVPDPTDAQLADFFAKYRDADPDTSEFGFGYRFPNRVKIEYVKVPHDKLKATITDEDAAEVWLHNPQRFPMTQPAATRPGTTQPAASAQPTTRPFAEVKDQIKNDLADSIGGTIAKNIQRSMNGDYQTARSGSAVLPADLPPSSLGVPYNSPSYLRKLAESVQAQKDSRGVMPETLSDPNFMSRKDLAKLPGLGQAFIVSGGRFVSAADYLMTYADPFMTDAQRSELRDSGSQPLAVWQPSPVLRDVQGNFYVVCITAVDLAHPAPSLDAVYGDVKRDWKMAQAYQKAADAARKALEQARKDGLAATAQANGGRPVIETGLFYDSEDGRSSIPKYSLPPQAQASFIKGAFDLLRQRLKTGQQHPYGVIELAQARTYVVAQLEDARPAVEYPFFQSMQFEKGRQQEAERSAIMMMRWFNRDEVAQRMEYKSQTKGESGGSRGPTPAPAPEAPPLF